MRRLLPFLFASCAALSGEQLRIRPDTAKLAVRDAYVSAPPRPAKAPFNVVLIVADDLGRSDTSLYPGPQTLKTPNLEALAKAGTTFDAAYVTAPLCSPSRAALLTGRYQQRFGHEGQPHERYAQNALEYFGFKTFIATGDWKLTRRVSPDDEDVQRQGLPKSEVTLAEVLKHHGYATGHFGKWHLGWNDDFQPHRRGFDTSFGFYEAYTLYATPPERDDVVNQHHDEFSDRFIWDKGRTGTATLRRNGVETTDDGYLPDRLAAEAIAFMRDNRERPFFVYLPLPNPHTPHQAKRTLYAQYANEPDPARRAYLALIRSLDDTVGTVLSELDALKLTGNTLVVFVSDNGAALYTGASNPPFKGGKFTLFEGGIRVPMVMRWPNQLPAGLHFAPPVSALDVFATIAAALDAELPAGRPYDGVDLRAHLANQTAPHDTLFWRAGYAKAVRRGAHKLVVDASTGNRALHDLEKDPGESVDLLPSNPALAAELEQALQGWEAQCRAPLWPWVMDYRFTDRDGREFFYPL